MPRFLLERWERVKQGGVPLGSLIVDNSLVSQVVQFNCGLTLLIRRSATPPKITLKLPAEEEKPKGATKSEERERKRARLDTTGIPDEYEVVLPSHTVKNTYVFTEHERTWVAQPGEENSAARRKREKGG